MNNKENTPKAIIYIILGMSVFAFQDSFIKILSSETNIFFIYSIRSFLVIVLLSFFLLIKKEPIIFKTNYPILTLLRGFLFFIAFSLYYFSLTKLSLATAITLFFVSPFFITILSIIFLKEKIGLHRWVAIIIGFIGVFLVMDPDMKNFNFYTTFPVICAFGYALTMIIQKKTSDKDNLYSQTFHINIFALFFSVLIGFFTYDGKFSDPSNENLQFLFREWKFISFNIFLMILLIGILAVIGFLSIFQAYRIGSPPSIAPFEYILIIWALIISWVFWKQTLSISGYFGLLLIILGGFYTIIRERKNNAQVTLDKSIR